MSEQDNDSSGSPGEPPAPNPLSDSCKFPVKRSRKKKAGTRKEATPKKETGKKKAPAKKRARKRTRTSSFGTSGRISHDSSKFYDSRLYEGTGQEEKEVPQEAQAPDEVTNRLYCKSSEVMDDLPDNSVHLMVTSPPYNVQKDYDQDLSLQEYRTLLRNVFSETYRKLAPGGRACINVANLGRKPYIPLHSYIITDMIEIGYLMRGEIIWDKGSSGSSSTAWGSWKSASNPVLRDVHEYILIFCKGGYSRIREDRVNTISRDGFLEWTKSVWHFPAVSAKRIGHPAPFPEELPARLIDLYTFEGDLVLDPFVGSGSTCVAAKRLKRRWVGYDLDQTYIDLAQARIGQGRLF
jgi:site-specific DNA-methyltransferase (adenine-specific)